MKTTKEQTKTVMEIRDLVNEWLGYVKGVGNECAYTDSILELIQKKAKEL